VHLFSRLLLLVALTSSAWAQEFESAQRAFDARDYATAAELFEKAKASDLRCDADFYIGLARYHLNQLDAAVIAFKAAVQCDPKLIRANLALAEVYVVTHNDAEALRAYTQVLNAAPRDAAALRGAAAIYLRNENNEKALTLLETLIIVEPGDRQARVDLGAAYAATGRRDRAETQFREALRLDADDPSALTGLGNLFERKGEDDKAIPVLLKAIKIAPQAFEPRFVLGSAYNRLGRYSEARTELKAALRLGGVQSPEVYYQLAHACGSLGLDEERRTMLAKFSELTSIAKVNAENKRAVARLLQEAEALINSGELRDAVAKLQIARSMEPANDHLLFRLAGLQYDLKDYESARMYVQQAIRIAPSEWVYHFLLGLTEADSGRLSQARDSLEVAARLNPTGAQVQNALEKVRRALSSGPG
jgi:tetratricopeptide (TPR) repeat protein